MDRNRMSRQVHRSGAVTGLQLLAIAASAVFTAGLVVALLGIGGQTGLGAERASAATAQVSAESPLSWSAPELIDDQPPLGDTYIPYGMSCPTASFCVAVDNGGGVYTSTNPTGGAGEWSPRTDIIESGGLYSISCPSASLCVAGDFDGNIYTSTNPTGGAGAWSGPINIAGDNILTSISCPSASFCAVVDDDYIWDDGGNVYTSTNPTGGPGAWSSTSISPGAYNGLRDISCPSASFCAATDSGGRPHTSTNPTGGAGAWAETDVGNDNRFTRISCPSSSLCVGIGSDNDFTGGTYVVTSTDPTGGAATWTRATIKSGYTPSLEAITCPSTSFCAGIDEEGNVFTSTNPTGGAAAWTSDMIDDADSAYSISCPSASLCAVGGDGGLIHTSTDPGGTTPWSSAEVVGFSSLYSVSCPSASFCAAGDDAGKLLTSTDQAGGAGTWSATAVASRQLDAGRHLLSISLFLRGGN